jgi:lysophospholipid acyltransferase (LPLAT)-like uncharacterized protein
VAEYLRLIHKTSTVVIEPADIYERVIPDIPVIVAMWHGQHLMMPFLSRPRFKVKALISFHGDGEINAVAAERLGIATIRGSGDRRGHLYRKGGVTAFSGMLDALADGCNVALTADFPKVARVAGPGIVMLARSSGRPIYPVAVATSRRIQLRNWDRMAVNLPFSRMATVVGEPVRLPANADKAVVERARQAVEQRLNAATARAYELVDARSAFSVRKL